MWVRVRVRYLGGGWVVSGSFMEWFFSKNSCKDSSMWFILESPFLFIRDYYLAIILLVIVKVRCVTLEVNLESLPDTILLGIPRNRKISLRNNLATSRAPSIFFIRKKCAILVRRSTTIKMVSYPPQAIGSLVIKSMKIDSHFLKDISKGWILPGILCCSTFICWHCKHSWTWWRTSRFSANR